MIEDAYIEVDGGYGDSPPYKTKGFLVLTGDFVDEFGRYLCSANATTVSLEISRDIAEKLRDSINEVLYG